MQIKKRFSDQEKTILINIFNRINKNPYTDYKDFKKSIKDLVPNLPDFLYELCTSIKNDRTNNNSVHFLKNCPIDIKVPILDNSNPLKDKYEKKKTYIGEVFLQIISELTDTPIFTYGSRHNGDFFHDVYGLAKYEPSQPQKIYEDVYFHNDRAVHKIRADYITLLGMRNCEENLIYTTIIDGRDIIKHLSLETQKILREKYFETSSNFYPQNVSECNMVLHRHAILEDENSFRYCSTRTMCISESPVEARDALICLNYAIIKSRKKRFKIYNGDLLCVPNQDYLHSREIIEINNTGEENTRWLLKTYNFKNRQVAEHNIKYYVKGAYGLIKD